MSATPAAEQWRPRVNPWLIAPVVMLPTFMEVLDTSIASVALPYIAGNLGATTSEATWVLTSYLISNAVVLPASGWFSRYFGRKRFLLSCIAIFTIASFFCGAARTLPMLILARIIQGAGGGALQPLAQSILLESFPPARRGAAGAVYGIGVVCAPILGPVLGGWLTDTWSWRWAFYINIPVGILAVFLISMVVEDPPYLSKARPSRIDGVGFGFMALGLASLQILLDKGQELDWFSSIWLRWAAGISVFSLVFFCFWELRVKEPIVNLRILRNRNLAAGCGLFFLFGAAIYGMITLQPLFLQTLLGYTALNAGATISPRGLGALCALFTVGIMIARIGGRQLAAAGFVIFSISAWLFCRLSLDVGMRNIVLANFLNGFGAGFVFVPLTTVSMGTLPLEDIGNATGIQNLLRNIGGSVGISFVATMLERFSQAHQVFLTAHYSPLDPLFQERLASVQSALAPHFNKADTPLRAQAMLGGILHQQAGYWAFINVFYCFVWMGMGCAVGVWLLRNVHTRGLARAH